MFVIDSQDRDRIVQVKEELHHFITEDKLVGLPILIFANKRDLPNCFPIDELTELLEMSLVKDRKWKIVESIATEGIGIEEGLHWLHEVIIPLPKL